MEIMGDAADMKIQHISLDPFETRFYKLLKEYILNYLNTKGLVSTVDKDDNVGQKQVRKSTRERSIRLVSSRPKHGEYKQYQHR